MSQGHRAPWSDRDVHVERCPGGSLGGYTGWVPGRAIPGTGSTTQLPRAEPQEPIPSGAGPGSPCQGLEWVGYGWEGDPFACPSTGAHPAPGPPTPALWAYGARFAVQDPPCGQKARFHDISQKLRQNGQVSTKSVEKACHSPCLPKRVRKSPLEFLRFPFWPAFSPKELMGPF